MIPHVSLQIVTTTADSVHLIYHCAACGNDSPAIVSAVSRGLAEAHYFIGQDRAREESAAQAAAGLPSAIQRTVGVAGCPHCAAREPYAARSTKLSALGAALISWIGVLASLMVIAGVIGLFESSKLVEVAISSAFIVGGMLVIAPLAAYKYKRLVREAATLVVWEGHE
jgi:hypothetical protein